MLSAILIMAAILANLSATGDIDRQQLVQLIESAQGAGYRDVSFDYEGKWAFPGQAKPEQIENIFTGSFTARADGANLIDVYSFKPLYQQSFHDLVAIVNETATSSTRRGDQKSAAIGVNKLSPLRYAGAGNYRQIWLADLVKRFAASPYFYEFEGFRPLDGVECAVVRFRLLYTDDAQTPKAETPSEIFWVDLNRGGHVLRRESRVRGENLAEVATVQLQRFEPRPGRVVWLPASGRVEYRVAASPDFQPIYVTEPVSYLTYDLLLPSLRFDRGLKDEFFTVKPRTGDVVSDQIRKAQYEFGQYMIRPVTVTRQPTDAEVKAELDRMLKDSKVMATELKASSPAQEESGWWSRWPWAIVGLATLGAGLVYYRQRRA